MWQEEPDGSDYFMRIFREGIRDEPARPENGRVERHVIPKTLEDLKASLEEIEKGLAVDGRI